MCTVLENRNASVWGPKLLRERGIKIDLKEGRCKHAIEFK